MRGEAEHLLFCHMCVPVTSATGHVTILYCEIVKNTLRENIKRQYLTKKGQNQESNLIKEIMAKNGISVYLETGL